MFSAPIPQTSNTTPRRCGRTRGNENIGAMSATRPKNWSSRGRALTLRCKWHVVLVTLQCKRRSAAELNRRAFDSGVVILKADNSKRTICPANRSLSSHRLLQGDDWGLDVLVRSGGVRRDPALSSKRRFRWGHPLLMTLGHRQEKRPRLPSRRK